MHAVLRVDLQLVLSGIGFDEFINPSRAIACLRPCVGNEVGVDGDQVVPQSQVRGLVFGVVGVADEHA